MHTHIYLNTRHAYIYTHTYIHTPHIHICIYKYISKHTGIHIYTHTHIYTQTQLHTHMHTHLFYTPCAHMTCISWGQKLRMIREEGPEVARAKDG